MTFCHPTISGTIDLDNGYVNTIVIENRTFFHDLIYDISEQIDGHDGKSVIGNDENILDFSKQTELITSFIPFDINKKTLISKITAALEKTSLNDYNYEKTSKLLADIERYMDDISSEFDCNMSYSKITPSTLIKSVGIEIADDWSCLGEKIIDYMELVREFDRDKIFIMVNLRSYIDDIEMTELFKTSINHGFHLLLIDNKEYALLEKEKRIIIDEDLCAF